jgi:hypothetical protein
VGTAASNASTQSTAIGDNLTQLNNQQGSVSAVNIDEETANLHALPNGLRGRHAHRKHRSSPQQRRTQHGIQFELLTDMRIDPNMVPSLLAELQQSQVSLNTALQQVSTGLV